MLSPGLPPLPTRAGAYRWFYADAHAGDRTAVFILLVGSVFSARYVTAARRGGVPARFCAVNAALYVRGERRAFVFSEYDQVDWSPERLQIGQSSLERRGDGGVRIRVSDVTAMSGVPVTAELELEAPALAYPELPLRPGAPHLWQPLAPRARATLRWNAEVHRALAYHDTNHGPEPLGGEVRGWTWARAHGPERTRVRYAVSGVEQTLSVSDDGRIDWAESRQPPPLAGAWGLPLPRRLEAEGRQLRVGSVLESSPFYARLEAEEGGVHVLGEVADFHRFRSPWFRWMARLRTRVEAG